MNNQNPFFNPFLGFYNNEQNINYEKLIKKIDQLEKNINNLETRIKKIETKDKNTNSDEPTDMYMI